MGILIGIILGIIASVIANIIGFYTGNRIYTFLKARMHELRSILPFDFTKNKPIVLAYGSIPPTDITNTHTVEQGDLIALLKAYEIAAMIGKDKSLLVYDGLSIYSSYELHANIFTISGPKWNPVTRILLGRLGAPITFTKTPKGIIVKTTKMKKEHFYECKKEEAKLQKICYGVILAGEVENNSGTKQNVLICSGASTLSTNGCLLFLSQLSKSQIKVKQVQSMGLFRQKKWGLLVKIKNNKSVDSIHSPLHENDVSITIEKIFFQKDFLPSYLLDTYPNQI
jgi:hypothetical protein